MRGRGQTTGGAHSWKERERQLKGEEEGRASVDAVLCTFLDAGCALLCCAALCCTPLSAHLQHTWEMVTAPVSQARTWPVTWSDTWVLWVETAARRPPKPNDTLQGLRSHAGGLLSGRAVPAVQQRQRQRKRTCAA